MQSALLSHQHIMSGTDTSSDCCSTCLVLPSSLHCGTPKSNARKRIPGASGTELPFSCVGFRGVWHQHVSDTEMHRLYCCSTKHEVPSEYLKTLMFQYAQGCTAPAMVLRTRPVLAPRMLLRYGPMRCIVLPDTVWSYACPWRCPVLTELCGYQAGG